MRRSSGPGAPASATLISRCGREHEAGLAWHTPATLAYLIARQQSTAAARKFLRGLLGRAEIAPTTSADAKAALDWPMPDHEDALRAAAAIACGAQAIITGNERDFKGSPVAAMTPEAFLKRRAPAD